MFNKIDLYHKTSSITSERIYTYRRIGLIFKEKEKVMAVFYIADPYRHLDAGHA